MTLSYDDSAGNHSHVLRERFQKRSPATGNAHAVGPEDFLSWEIKNRLVLIDIQIEHFNGRPNRILPLKLRRYNAAIVAALWQLLRWVNRVPFFRPVISYPIIAHGVKRTDKLCKLLLLERRKTQQQHEETQQQRHAVAKGNDPALVWPAIFYLIILLYRHVVSNQLSVTSYQLSVISKNKNSRTRMARIKANDTNFHFNFFVILALPPSVSFPRKRESSFLVFLFSFFVVSIFTDY